MKSEELFVTRCLNHYTAKLVEETHRFGITLVSREFIDTEETFLPKMGVWKALSEADGKYYAPVLLESGDFLLVVSTSEIPRPSEYAKLWLIVREIEHHINSGWVDSGRGAIESLDLYGGPYRLEVPEELLSRS